MSKIEQLRTRRQQAHKQLLGMKSKVYEAFLKMEAATYADGALPKKTKELIAVGISVVIDCESCMEWHITQAAREGASQQGKRQARCVGAPTRAGGDSPR
jgi:AhpD family alkylhydroperoxidase